MSIAYLISSKIEKFKNIFFQNVYLNRTLFVLFLIVLCVGMYILNYGTPLMADDYSYSFASGGGDKSL